MSYSRNKEGDSVAGAGWVKNQCGTSGKGVQRGKGGGGVHCMGLGGLWEGFGFHSEGRESHRRALSRAVTCSDLGVSRFTWLWAGQ